MHYTLHTFAPYAQLSSILAPLFVFFSSIESVFAPQYHLLSQYWGISLLLLWQSTTSGSGAYSQVVPHRGKRLQQLKRYGRNTQIRSNLESEHNLYKFAIMLGARGGGFDSHVLPAPRGQISSLGSLLLGLVRGLH